MDVDSFNMYILHTHILHMWVWVCIKCTFSKQNTPLLLNQNVIHKRDFGNHFLVTLHIAAKLKPSGVN